MKLWVKILVTALFLAAIFWKVEWHELWHEARSLDGKIWLGVLALILVAHTLGAFKWRINVNLGRSLLRPLDAIQCYGAGLFANLCLPSIIGGDALKAILAGKLTGSFEAAIFGGITDRLLDSAAILVLLATGALLSHASVPGAGGQALLLGTLIGVAVLGLALPFVLRVRLARWPRRLRRPIGRALVAMRRLARRPLLALRVLLLSLSIQTLLTLLNAWLGRGIGIDVPLAFWFLAVPLTKAITLVPISLGGFGLREAALSTILAVVGVPHDKGVAVSLVWQSLLVSTGLIGGLCWFLLGFRRTARTGARHGPLLHELEAREAPEAKGA